MKNKYCILCVKNLLVENHGGHRCRNFSKLFLVKQSDFWGGILQKEK